MKFINKDKVIEGLNKAKQSTWSQRISVSGPRRGGYEIIVHATTKDKATELINKRIKELEALVGRSILVNDRFVFRSDFVLDSTGDTTDQLLRDYGVVKEGLNKKTLGKYRVVFDIFLRFSLVQDHGFRYEGESSIEVYALNKYEAVSKAIKKFPTKSETLKNATFFNSNEPSDFQDFQHVLVGSYVYTFTGKVKRVSV